MKITFTSPFHVTGDNIKFSGKPEVFYDEDSLPRDWPVSIGDSMGEDDCCVSWCKGTNKWEEPKYRLILLIMEENIWFWFWGTKGLRKGKEVVNPHWLNFYKKK
jgi:hypothetical protein